MNRFDPIEMEVFSNRLLSITDEMSTVLLRSSFSTNIKERKDCSVGIFDREGRLVAQASHIPLHLGSLTGGVAAVRDAFRAEEIGDGDAFICNDPYLAGGTHLPDITIVTPVFWDGALEFFVANIGHHTDVGGSVPGSSSHLASSIYEEGIRIPATLVCRAGVRDDRLIELVAQNSRDANERRLDLGVQISTNERGARLVHALLRRNGVARTRSAIDDLLAYTEQRMGNRIAELPDGDFAGTAYLDNDGHGDERVPIHVTLRVRGRNITFDFAGSGTQARGNLNVPASALEATCYYALKSLLDPNLPPNEGMFAAVEIAAPEGTIVNPRSPAPVASRSATCQKIARAIFLAFTEVLPADLLMAPSTDMNAAMVLSGPRVRGGGSFVYLETVGGGAGARMEADGMHAVQVHITNTTNLPAEAMEIEYPLLVREYGLADESCGAGRTRGGAGIVREIEATADGVVVSVRADGAETPAPGLFGGGEGGRARLTMNPGRDGETAMPLKVAAMPLTRGSSIRLETPGGGGFGPPGERSAERLARDLRHGLLSEAEAREAYGDAAVAQALE